MSAGGWGLLAFSLSAMGIIALAYVRLCSFRAPASVLRPWWDIPESGSTYIVTDTHGHVWRGTEYPCSELWPVPEASACDGVDASPSMFLADDPYYTSQRAELARWWEKDVDPRFMVPAEAVISPVRMIHAHHWALIHVAPNEVDAYSALGWTVVQ